MTALGQKPEDGLFSINVCDRCKADPRYKGRLQARAWLKLIV